MSMIYSADAFKPMLKYNKNIYLYICQKKKHSCWRNSIRKYKKELFNFKQIPKKTNLVCIL